MDFLNKTKGTLLSAGKNISQKASGASGAVAVSMRIREEEKTLNDSIAALGKMLLEYHTEEAKRLFPEQFAAIQSLMTQIDKDKKELAVCKGLRICPNCGAEQQPEAMCCTMCGINMNEAQAHMAERSVQMMYCSVCGAEIGADSRFCPKCGSAQG